MKKLFVNYKSNKSHNLNIAQTICLSLFFSLNFALVLALVTTIEILSPNSTKAQVFGNLTKEHQDFHKFVGEWNQISSFTNLEGKKTQTKGRMEGSVIMSGTLLELKGLQGNQQIITESLVYIGYDKSLEKFFLHGYDRNGGIPNTYIGNYDKSNNKYTFETYMIDAKKGRILSTFEIWFEREDKFIYKVTIHDPGNPIVIAEVANIKVENNSNDAKTKNKQKLKK